MRALKPFLLLALSAAVAAAASLPAPYTTTPGAKEYPGADVLVLSETREVTLAADGRITERVRRVEKVLTYQGMDAIGDTKVAFRKGDQAFQDASLKTFTPEGEVKEAKANSFIEMTPFALGLAPDYALWRQVVMSKIGLDLGCVVESTWTVEDLKPWRKRLDLNLPLSDGFPALERKVVVRVPAGTPLLSEVRRLPAEALIEKARREGEFEVTTWTVKNQAALPVGELGHGEEGFLPRLLATTCPDLKALNEDYAGPVQAAIGATSPRLKAKAAKLVEGAATPLQKIVALHSYVAESIRTVAWPLEAFAYTPRSAPAVLESGYGHALDKAVLLCALLQEVGMSGTPALVGFFPEAADSPEAVPCAAQFDRIIVRAKAGEEVHWLDPAAPLSEASHADFQGYAGVPMLQGFGEIHAMNPVGPEDRFELLGEVELDGDLGLKGKAALTLSGVYCPYYEVQGSSEALEAHLQGLVKSLLPGSKLTAHSVSALAPSELKVLLQFEREAKKGEGAAALTTGVPSASVLAHLGGMHRNGRTFPLLLPSGGIERVLLTFRLPKGKAPKFLPAAWEHACDGAKASGRWSVEAGVLTLSWEADFRKRVISPDAYPAFRALSAAPAADTSRTVLF